MQKISLDALAREHLKRARSAPSGRSAETVYGGHEHVLRQALMTLVKGRSLAEHENPGEATVLVLRGRVRLTAGADVWEAREGDLLIVPGARHNLEAVEDSAVLLTVAKAKRADTGLTSRQRGCRPLAGHAHGPSSWLARAEELTAPRAPVRAQDRESLWERTVVRAADLNARCPCFVPRRCGVAAGTGCSRPLWYFRADSIAPPDQVFRRPCSWQLCQRVLGSSQVGREAWSAMFVIFRIRGRPIPDEWQRRTGRQLA